MTKLTVDNLNERYHGTEYVFEKAGVAASKYNNRQLGYLVRKDGKLWCNYKTLKECLAQVEFWEAHKANVSAP